MSVGKIYNMFENARKKHKTYNANRFSKEKEYKELIKFIIDKKEAKEAEIILKLDEL